MRTSQDRPGADLCPTGQRRCELGNAEFGLFDLALAHFTGGYPRDPDIDSRPAPGRGASHIPSTTGGALLPLSVQQISTSLGADSAIVTRSSRTIIRARSRSRSVCRCAPAIFNVELDPILSAPSTPPLPSAITVTCIAATDASLSGSTQESDDEAITADALRPPTFVSGASTHTLSAVKRLSRQTHPDCLDGTCDLTQRFLSSTVRHPLVDLTLRGCREALGRRLFRVSAMFVRSPSLARSEAKWDSGASGGLDKPHSGTNKPVRESDPRNLMLDDNGPTYDSTSPLKSRCVAAQYMWTPARHNNWYRQDLFALCL